MYPSDSIINHRGQTVARIIRGGGLASEFHVLNPPITHLGEVFLFLITGHV